MRNNEEGCIRYLMREMDPSEEIEFEREMMQDENLLIEVESLRKTYQKLGKLPLKTPPEELARTVTDKAIQAQKDQIKRSQSWIFYMSRSVAAVAIAILVVSAGLYVAGISDPTPTNQSAISNNATVSNATTIQPWVNRNHTIEFVGTSVQNNNDEALQNEVAQSFDKLRLVNTETGFNAPTRKILLTSSHR